MLTSGPARAPSWDQDPKAGFYRSLILETAGAYKRDFIKFDRYRADVATAVGIMYTRPMWMADIDRELESGKLTEAERLQRRAMKVYHELVILTEKDKFYQEYPALASTMAGYENPYAGPTDNLSGFVAANSMNLLDERSMTPYLTTLPIACLRPDFSAQPNCRKQVENACADYYQARDGELLYWELSDDLEMNEKKVVADHAEPQRLKGRMVAYTPRSAQAAQLSAKALLGVCGLAATQGYEFGKENVFFGYQDWPEWTRDFPEARAMSPFPNDLCRELSAERRENIMNLAMSHLDPYSSERAFELVAAVGACPAREVANLRESKSANKDFEKAWGELESIPER